jgi:PAS domain S-box-containing protein
LYRILYVDDEPALLEIGKLFLEQSGQLIVDTITSAPAALALLSSKSYDAIIADYQMPDMDGIEFLKTVRASGNSIPFILFTGRGREEVVIQALNEGADFYLQKGGEPKSQFTELSNNILYAMMRRRSEDSLRQSEAQLRQIIDLVPHMIYAKDRDGKYLLANRAVAEGYNTTVANLEGISHARFHSDPVELRHMLEDDREVMMTGKTKFIPEEPYVDAFGKHRFLQTTKVPFTTSGNNQQAVLGISIDITEHKRVEEELKKKNEELNASYEQLTATEEELRENYNELAKSQKLLSESETQYRNVVEDQTEFISRFLPDGTHVFVNEAYCRYFGLKRDGILGHRFRPEIPVEDREIVKRFFASLTPDHPVDSIEHRIIMPDGSIRWQRWSDRAIFDREGHIREYQSVGRDVTDRKNAENELQAAYEQITAAEEELRAQYDELRNREQVIRESEQKLQGIVQGSPIPQFVIDKDHRVVSWNRALEDYSGVSAKEVVGTTHAWKAFYDSERPVLSGLLVENNTGKIREFYAGKIHKSKYVEGACEVTDFFPRMGGHGIWLHFTAAPIRDDEGNIIGAVETLEDITERKKAEEELQVSYEQLAATEEELRHQFDELKKSGDELRESEEKFRTLFNNANDAIYLHEVLPDNRPGKFLEVNDTLCSRLGYTRKELLAMTVGEIVSDAHRQRMGEISEQLTRERIHSFYGEHKRKDGSVFPVEINSHRFTFSGREIVLVSARDITERKQVEEAIRESEEKFRGIFDSINDGIHIHEITPDGKPGKFIEVNEVACRMLQYTRKELLERGPLDFVTEFHNRPFNDIIAELSATGHSIFETEHRRKDGTIFPVEINSHVVGLKGKKVMVSVVRDITERKQAGEALQQANKKIALLTNITRHDLNNQILALNGFVELLHEKIADPALENYFTWIMQVSDRISSMIQFTKAYESIGETTPRWQDIRDLVETAAKQVPTGNIVVQNDLPGGAEVFADPLIVKVCYNLIDNAVRHGRGITTITFSAEEHDGAFVIACEDNGDGIPEALKEKIFEQGFGKNTGLGLFLARLVLSITGITIRETGEPGKGARFEVTVPREKYRTG